MKINSSGSQIGSPLQDKEPPLLKATATPSRVSTSSSLFQSHTTLASWQSGASFMVSQVHPRSVVPDVNTEKKQILAVCKLEQNQGWELATDLFI